MQKFDHAHVQIEVAHRDGRVFRLYRIDADHARLAALEIQAGHELREHFLGRRRACHCAM